MADVSEPTKLDTAVSDACTRSGTFALLLSLVLVLLIPYWMERPIDTALGQYLSDRFNLANNLDALEHDLVWQKYKASHDAAESVSIVQLATIEVDINDNKPTGATERSNTAGPTFRGERAPRTTSPKAPSGKSTNALPTTPAPPTILLARVSYGLAEMPQLADLLSNLNDSDILSRSRQYSNYFDLSVVRWVTKRNSMVYQNELAGACAPKVMNAIYKGRQPKSFVPALDHDALLQCLTVGNIQELAEFDLPQVYNPPQFGEQIGRQIDVTPGALPRDPYLASVLGQILLFFAIVYFGAFAREAVSSKGFPTSGTLFGAFCRSRWNLFVFFLTLWSPFAVSLSIAVTSRRWVLAVCSVAIFGAVLSAHRVLQSKSYFGSLRLMGAQPRASEPRGDPA